MQAYDRRALLHHIEATDARVAALEAAARTYLLHDGSGIGEQGEWRGDFDALELSAARTHLRALLRALPAAAAERPLDVERLARALYVIWPNDPTWFAEPPWYRERARAIAAEYARLSEADR